MDHPRWGIIQSLVATRDILAGEELYAYYFYKKKPFPLDFPWYFDLKRRVKKEQRLKDQCKKY